MLSVASPLPLESIEPALRRAAQQHGASVIAVTHVGQHLPQGAGDAFVFGVCHAEVYEALLAADLRMSAFLPCRIAAYSQEGRTTLTSISPLECCRLLNRPDLAPLTAPLESLLVRIMEEAAQPSAAAVPATAGAHRGGLGATEDQMNVRGSIPQRIDCHGTKVEDMAGTGAHDSQGG
jgi:uncharacterized protein (DUF302 family)